MQKTPLILAAALAAMALAPAAAQVPTLDIEKTCRAAQPLFGPDTTAATGNAGDANLGNSAQSNPYQTCMQSETAARKSAEDLWSKVDATDRGNCVVLSRMVYPSYVELLSCLQMYNPATSGIGPNEQDMPPARATPNRRL
jgi:hypothetical protein